MDQALKLPFADEYPNVDTLVLPQFESISADDVRKWAAEVYQMTAISEAEYVRITRILKTYFAIEQIRIPYDDMLVKLEEALMLVQRAR